MNHDEYLSCEQYEQHTPPNSDGFTSFQDENTKLYYFALLDLDGKVLLKSESYPTEAARNNGISSVIKNRSIESHYSLKKDEENGLYYQSLRAANYREIARSCDCKSEEDAMNLLVYLTGQKLRSQKPKNQEDDYLECALYTNRGKPDEDGMVAFFDEETKAYFFAVVNKKGHVLFRSESYPSTAARDNGIASVRKNRDIKERFSVIQDEADSKYYVILKAGNHKEIARSCGYDSEAAAWDSLNSDAIHDDYMPCNQYKNRGEASEDGIIAFYDEASKGYYFSVLDGNGKVMFRSEHYPNEASRDNGMASVRKNRTLKERYATIKDENDGQYYVILKAGNHKEIARSCPSDTAAGLAWLLPLATPEISTTIVAESAPLLAAAAPKTEKPSIKPIVKEREDDYLSCQRYANQGLPDIDGIVQFFDVPSQSYLFSVVDVKGKILLRSEQFSTVERRKKEMDAVRKYKHERSHYEIIQNKENNRYYVLLRNEDGDEIARSCSYEDKDLALAMLPPIEKEGNSGLPLVAAGAALLGAAAIIPNVDIPPVVIPEPVVIPPVVATPPVVEPEPVFVPPVVATSPVVVPEPVVVPPVVSAAPVIEPEPIIAAAPVVAEGGFKWWWLLPLLLLIPLFFWWKGCKNEVNSTVTPPVVVDTLKKEVVPVPVAAPKDTQTTAAVIPSKSGNIILRHIFFDFDKADLVDASHTELDKLVKVLKENPKYSCELKAFTDAKGSDAYNKALSNRRANNAKSHLIKNGIDKARIKTSTFGEANPIAKNEIDGQDTEEGRRFNRRVEIIVLDEAGKPVGIVENIAIPSTLKQ